MDYASTYLNHSYQDRLTLDDVDALLETDSGPCVSLFLSTSRVSSGTAESRIRLKNLRREAFERLTGDLGLRRPDAEAILLPVDDLLDDEAFWPYLSDGLAVFLSPEAQFVYRLPEPFAERVEVGERFKVRPLLPLLTGNGVYHLLAISRNEVRLLEGTRYGAREVTPDDLPRNMARALTLRGREGERLPHRQWQGDEGQKTLYRGFFWQIDRILRPSYVGRSEPLVVAAVDYLQPIFREATNYRHVVDEGIVGNPDEFTVAELHERAWPLVKPILEAPRHEALSRLHSAWGKDRATDDAATILRAAYNGRVQTLFVDAESEVPGKFDTATLEATFEGADNGAGSVDLVSIAARFVASRGGEVYSVTPDELPAERPMVAVLRY